MVDLHELTWTVVQDIDLSERIKKKKKKVQNKKYIIFLLYLKIYQKIYM